MTERDLSLEEELAVDALCESFERALQAGSDPVIADFVDGAPEELRGRLDRELRLLLAEAEGDLSTRGELPERFGPYRIVRNVGRGGMGVVYEAIQDHPRRRVALKVVRPDLLSARMRQRFGREVRLLAHLQHPGIARVLDAGSAPPEPGSAEVPYLAMEFVEGRPLLDHAREEGLSIRQRVALVRQMCLAIQHAHDQGVLHRDLKPANVIVTPEDSGSGGPGHGRARAIGRPVILDFGLARAIGERGGATLETLAGQVLGTLPHMAPEQLGADPDLLDGRCDVYGLGTVLYELLSGRLPLELQGLSIPAAMDRVRHEDPPLLGQLDPALRGDLETIAAKALERHPARRYASAFELGEDLQRHLDDVPVRARPAGALVQLGKFARRNPGLVGGVAAGGALMAIALVLVSIFAVRQRDLRDAAQDAADEARLEAAKARAVAEFQERMFDRANLASGGRTAGVTLLDVLLAGAAELDGAFEDQPLVEASLRVTIGEALTTLDELERAEPHLRRAVALRRGSLGPEHPETLEARSALGVLFEAAGRLEEARTEHEAVLAVRDARAEDHLGLVRSLGNLGAVLERQGEYERAAELHRRSIAMAERLLGPDSLEVAAGLNSLASAIESGGDLRGALPHYQRALAIRRAGLTPPHNLLANTLNNLGALHLRLLELDEARPLIEEALAMQEELLGPTHSIVANTLNNLSALHSHRGDHGAAEALGRRSVDALVANLGPDHRRVLIARSNLAILVERQGRHEEALQAYDELLADARRVLGERDRATLLLRWNRRFPLEDLGRQDEVDETTRPLLAACQEALGQDSLTGKLLREAAMLSWREGDVAGATDLFREAVETMAAVGGPGHPWTLIVGAAEIEFLRDTGRTAQALERARAAAATADAALGPDDDVTIRLRDLKAALSGDPAR